MVDILEQSCQQFRDRPAFENFDTVISFGELDRLSQSFAAALQARGLQKGDRVALMLPNTLQYPIALFGVLRAGMTEAHGPHPGPHHKHTCGLHN